MGIFKDLNDTSKQAKALRKNSPGAGQRFADMNTAMAAATSSLTPTSTTSATPSTTPLVAPATGSMPANVHVISTATGSGAVGVDLIVKVSALMFVGAMPPVPATSSVVVPAAQAHWLRPGANLPARVDPHDFTTFGVDWQRVDETAPPADR